MRNGLIAGCALSCTRSLMRGQGKCVATEGSGSCQYMSPSYYGVLSWHPQQTYNTVVACVPAALWGRPKDSMEYGHDRTFSPPPGSMAAVRVLFGHESQAQTLVTGTGPGTLLRLGWCATAQAAT